MKSLRGLGLASTMLALALFVACTTDDGATTNAPTAGDDAGDASSSTGSPDAATTVADGATHDADAAKEAPSDADAAIVDADAAVDANDGAPPAVNDCTSFTNHTGQNTVTITWDFGIANSVDRCIVVNAGTSITFSGALASHPLNPHGGDVPTPITTTNAGDSVTWVFPNAGTYGYVCGFHPFMNGAIKVVP